MVTVLHISRVLECRPLRSINGLKSYGIRGWGKKIQDKELNKLSFTSTAIRMIKSRRI
jgi:hypothetical protein